MPEIASSASFLPPPEDISLYMSTNNAKVTPTAATPANNVRNLFMHPYPEKAILMDSAMGEAVARQTRRGGGLGVAPGPTVSRIAQIASILSFWNT
jgi:hypothetical protein